VGEKRELFRSIGVPMRIANLGNILQKVKRAIYSMINYWGLP
jgi:hypothetical protein